MIMIKIKHKRRHGHGAIRGLARINRAADGGGLRIIVRSTEHEVGDMETSISVHLGHIANNIQQRETASV
jgi:hypothetical protein